VLAAVDRRHQVGERLEIAGEGADLVELDGALGGVDAAHGLEDLLVGDLLDGVAGGAGGAGGTRVGHVLLDEVLHVAEDEPERVGRALHEVRHAQGLDRQLELAAVGGETEQQLGAAGGGVDRHAGEVGGMELLDEVARRAPRLDDRLGI